MISFRLLLILLIVIPAFGQLSGSIVILPETCHDVQLAAGRGWELTSNVTSIPKFNCQPIDLDLDPQIMVEVVCDGLVYFKSYKKLFKYNYYGGCSKLDVFYINDHKSTIVNLDISVIEQSYYRQPNYDVDYGLLIFLLLLIIGGIVANAILRESTQTKDDDQLNDLKV